MSYDSKVKADHLKRSAYLYVRQSTLRQVLENTESTHRQYDLRQRAIALGWPEERIVVIDCDQAHSADSALQRDGFQELVGEVGLNRAGLVMGLEVSRLARNCADWHQLMQICGLTNTLILDKCAAINNVEQIRIKPVESARARVSTSHFSTGYQLCLQSFQPSNQV